MSDSPIESTKELHESKERKPRKHEHKCPLCWVPIDCDYICCENCDVNEALVVGMERYTKNLRANLLPPRGAEPETPTDTQRLDWLAFKGCIEIELYKSGRRPEWFAVAQGDHELGRGDTLRDAIDAAMEAYPDER